MEVWPNEPRISAGSRPKTSCLGSCFSLLSSFSELKIVLHLIQYIRCSKQPGQKKVCQTPYILTCLHADFRMVFLLELCGEVHPEIAPLQAPCCTPRSTEQSTFRGQRGARRCRQKARRGGGQQGAKRQKGHMKQVKYALSAGRNVNEHIDTARSAAAAHADVSRSIHNSTIGRIIGVTAGAYSHVTCTDTRTA